MMVRGSPSLQPDGIAQGNPQPLCCLQTFAPSPGRRNTHAYLPSSRAHPHALTPSTSLYGARHRYTRDTFETLAGAQTIEEPTRCRSSTSDSYGCHMGARKKDAELLTGDRVRTLTGKEIELDIEADYKVHLPSFCHRIRTWHHCLLTGNTESDVR